MLGKNISKDRLNNLAKTYSISTNINTKVFDVNGEKISFFLKTPCLFCKLIHKFEQSQENCRKSYLYGGYQAEKLGEPYIYFCPYGLVNWAVPVLEEDDLIYILVGGPVLMHEADDLLIEDIIQQIPLMKTKSNELKNSLSELNVVEPVRVRHLADLLMLVAKNLMDENERLQERKRINGISARIAETIHRLKENDLEEETIYPIEKEDTLISRVKVGDKQGARETLNEILGFVYFQSGNKFFLVKSKAIELMVVLARAAIEVGADLEIIFGLEYTYLERINSVKDIEELSGLLTKVLDRFVDCTFSIKNVKNKDIIYRAMNFIRENYDQNISLDDVASEVHLSSSYFSKLFKDEMNISYTDYLNRVRIEAGKQLLKENHSLADIAQITGFSDQSYFSKVFKKIEGISPGKWRNNLVQNSLI